MFNKFARHSISLEVCTYGGPDFASHEFSAFARVFDSTHVIPSPRFPRSNGLAKKGLEVIKRSLKKTENANDDF